MPHELKSTTKKKDFCFQNSEKQTQLTQFSPQTPRGIVENVRVDVVGGGAVWPAGERHQHILSQGRQRCSDEFRFQLISRGQVPEQPFISKVTDMREKKKTDVWHDNVKLQVNALERKKKKLYL